MPSQQICAFNGIFLNDFTTSVTSLLYSGGKSYGPIAVFRNLYAPGYQVSEKSGLTTCATTDPGFSDYGLVVQGNIEATGYPSVRGNTYLYGTGSVTLEIPTCKFRNTTSSAFDFATSATKYKASSLYLANLRPDLNLDSNNVLSSIGAQADPSYHVITLNSCNGPLVGCSGSLFGNSGTSNYSSAGGLISQLFNYTGFSSSGIQWPRDVTLVINVPITELTVLVLDSATPSIGMDGCQTIWNFFPVTLDGTYSLNNFATLTRRTQKTLSGLILAPLSMFYSE